MDQVEIIISFIIMEVYWICHKDQWLKHQAIICDIEIKTQVIYKFHQGIKLLYSYSR